MKRTSIKHAIAYVFAIACAELVVIIATCAWLLTGGSI